MVPLDVLKNAIIAFWFWIVGLLFRACIIFYWGIKGYVKLGWNGDN